MKCIFGYKVDPETKRPTIDPAKAAIVARVLGAPHGQRCHSAGPGALSVHTRDSRRRIILGHRDWYAQGKARIDLEPNPALAITPNDERWLSRSDAVVSIR